MSGKRPAGLLIDLDGTIWEDDELIPGAAEAVAAMRAAGLPLRFVTNTTRMTRSALAEKLERLGIPSEPDDVFTATLAAVIWLRQTELRRVSVYLPKQTFEEFAGFELVDEEPEVVVVGDLGREWTFDVMNRAFLSLLAGAEFLALHRNRYWKTEGDLALDAGAFVAALEYAANRSATLVGKPSAPLFIAAARSIGLDVEDVAMVGDSIRNDVAGAQAVGAMGILVRTGGFQPDQLTRSPNQPDLLVESVAALPDLLL